MHQASDGSHQVPTVEGKNNGGGESRTFRPRGLCQLLTEVDKDSHTAHLEQQPLTDPHHVSANADSYFAGRETVPGTNDMWQRELGSTHWAYIQGILPKDTAVTTCRWLQGSRCVGVGVVCACVHVCVCVCVCVCAVHAKLLTFNFWPFCFGFIGVEGLWLGFGRVLRA